MSGHDSGTTARDFFLYLAFAITLIWLVISAFMYSFELINLLIPDTTTSAYRYGAVNPSGLLTGAMASLIIVTPFLLGTGALINRDLKKNPEKKEFWARKWLLYAVLFLSFIISLADLAILLGSFLQGELTARFVWKAFIVLLISAKVFSYFFYDLRRDPTSSGRIPFFSGVALGAVVLVLAVVGFAVAGTPAEQRDRRLDNERVSDLEQITWGVESYLRENGSLPADLSELSYTREESLVDPETGLQYEYRVTGEDIFELCASFATSSYAQYEGEWEHGVGLECFTQRVVESDIERPTVEGEAVLEVVPVDNAEAEE